MRRGTLALAFLITLCATIAPAQSPCSAVSLPGQKRWVRFDIIGGRVAAVNAHHCKTREARHANPLTGVQESFSVCAKNGSPRISYRLAGPQHEVTIEIRGQNQLELACHWADGAHLVRYTQPLQGDVTLITGDGKEATRQSAPCLWRLWLAKPQLCQERLAPVLELLRSRWELTEQARQVERALLTAAEQYVASERPRWERLVRQLGDKSYQRRRAAHLELLAQGPRVAPFLREASPRRLDAEQRRRIAEICRELTPSWSDRPESVAMRLIEDKGVWLALMERREAEIRHRAARHFSLLCQSPVEFDPMADEPVRRNQLARLRSRFVRK